MCVPTDVMEWLMSLDDGGHAFIKSPWAQSFTSPGVPVTATSVPYFIKKTGTPQGDPVACFAWIILFDILLTMLKLDHATNGTFDFLVRTDPYNLRPAQPCSFADDLIILAASLANLNRQAAIISFFTLLTSLVLEPTKTVAASLNPPSLQTDKLTQYDWTWSAHDKQILHPHQMTDPIKYLGVKLDPDGSWTSLHSTITAKITAVGAIIAKTRAAPEITWVALSASVYAAIAYPAKFAPWSAAEYSKLFAPLDKLLRNISNHMASFSHLLLHLPKGYLGMGYKSLPDKVQEEKDGMRIRAQLFPSPQCDAMSGLLHRPQRQMAHPQMPGAPVNYGASPSQDIPSVKSWSLSLIEWARETRKGVAIPLPSPSDPFACPIPPPPVQDNDKWSLWLRQFDIQSPSDLVVTDPMGVPTWRITPSSPDPEWLNSHLPTLPNPVSQPYRRGLLLLNPADPHHAIECLGNINDHTCVRRWCPSPTPGPIHIHSTLLPLIESGSAGSGDQIANLQLSAYTIRLFYHSTSKSNDQ